MSGQPGRSGGHNRGPNERQRKLAKGYIGEGKSFKQAALEAGYRPSIGKLGPSAFRRDCPGVDAAFIEAAKAQTWSSEELRSLARARLVSDISRGKSSGTERAIEVLGKFKDLDWFVRNADVQVGIFAGLIDDDSSKTLEATAIPAKDTSEFSTS